MDSRPSVVELELELNLVLSPERSVPVPARLSYGSHDPYAVHITFHLDTGTPVTWVFSRELLVEGTFRPCGQGDVRIWPTRPHPAAGVTHSGRQSVLCLALTSPGGDALLEAPLPAVAAWLERAHRLVPPGGELNVLDLDSSLAELLA
ncbi:SsgA family sporulation/cell division regulator [Kitasatospora sp. NBC_01250]|uniref:SsgA family sporulation/cell division regulator n=1 Tax=unclassified Kitasatospora TaxID=2633591 RepID=UPI002E118B7E|nr:MULTISPECIES: SsgA family sporulation/cell division regulator [unclassified Kitasatospora]WSJ67453.1 SsgA family sporulation/cell division regulator [Kitasatospora sp. NBC_01302]